MMMDNISIGAFIWKSHHNWNTYTIYIDTFPFHKCETQINILFWKSIDKIFFAAVENSFCEVIEAALDPKCLIFWYVIDESITVYYQTSYLYIKDVLLCFWFIRFKHMRMNYFIIRGKCLISIYRMWLNDGDCFKIKPIMCSFNSIVKAIKLNGRIEFKSHSIEEMKHLPNRKRERADNHRLNELKQHAKIKYARRKAKIAYIFIRSFIHSLWLNQ